MRVERTGDGRTRRPPVLKTGRITGPHALPGDDAADGKTKDTGPRGYPTIVASHPGSAQHMAALGLNSFCGRVELRGREYDKEQ